MHVNKFENKKMLKFIMQLSCLFFTELNKALVGTRYEYMS